MRGKTKLTLAASFVGVVAMAAAAFGQAGPDSGSEPGSGEQPSRGDRPAAAARDGDGCGRDAVSRRAHRVVHSESTIALPDGFAMVTVDHGKVTKVDPEAGKITIERADGESVTATAVDETKVCVDGKAATLADIEVGDLARLASVRSDRFTGLRRVGAHSPGAEPAAEERSS